MGVCGMHVCVDHESRRVLLVKSHDVDFGMCSPRVGLTAWVLIWCCLAGRVSLGVAESRESERQLCDCSCPTRDHPL